MEFNKSNIEILPSEMPLNSDGSVFHLHIRPENLADKVLLVGDPDRVTMIAAYLDKDSIECDVQSRSYHTITGRYKGERITILSHGIGVGNIDIVMTELDILANVDLKSRTIKSEHKSLSLVRMGTCGSLQGDIEVGQYVVSEASIGMDGLMSYYGLPSDSESDKMISEFVSQTGYDYLKYGYAKPYFIRSDNSLVDKIGEGMKRGITLTSPGFYAPQGRSVRAVPTNKTFMTNVSKFSCNGMRITNMEMESAPIQALASQFGHKAVTICLIIAGRTTGKMDASYHGSMEDLAVKVLDRIIL